jgi:hypothetical protein
MRTAQHAFKIIGSILSMRLKAFSACSSCALKITQTSSKTHKIFSSSLYVAHSEKLWWCKKSGAEILMLRTLYRQWVMRNKGVRRSIPFHNVQPNRWGGANMASEFKYRRKSIIINAKTLPSVKHLPQPLHSHRSLVSTFKWIFYVFYFNFKYFCSAIPT